jgi:pimeloyl-ACP methyl ester carboxylesterase
MRVFLIHGMNRSRLSMALLGRHLRRRGHAPSLFGYSVTRKRLDLIADDFLAHILATRERDGARSAPYAVVGHSLGNIITRMLTDRLPGGLSRFVMLGPPNHPPALARALRTHPAFRMVTGHAGQKLADRAFYARLQRPTAPTLIIAGDAGTGLIYRKRRANDGIVSVDETRLEGVPHRVVPAIHTLIMNHAEARTLIDRFLAEGTVD